VVKINSGNGNNVSIAAILLSSLCKALASNYQKKKYY